MPLQHYLPATFLAGFSNSVATPRRASILAAADLAAGRTFSTSASNLAGVNDIYTLTASQLDPQMVDQSLSGYEANLANAIAQLKARDISAMTWATTLVPFVCGLLVRGPDFNLRFEERMSMLGVDTPPDNTNFGRLMEFQRLLTPVSTAQWILLSIESDFPLITNDIGHAPFANPAVGHQGLAIPVDLTTVLSLVPRPARRVAIGFGGGWYPIIDYIPSPGDNHVQLNMTLAHRALRFIFGPDTGVVARYVLERVTPPLPIEPRMMGFAGGHQAMLHDLDWHRLITALSRPPQMDGQYIRLDLLAEYRRR